MRHADLHDGSDYSPCEGLSLTGRPVTVVLGGRIAIRDGERLGEPGRGACRHREISRLVVRARSRANAAH